ncbi:MGMT family protein [Dasania sp. GY-MA-18]|uniref:MGMT family protein n=1 Tax=Dasania phycosphaerae TaxID=2950436 RepID=A0A9J6RPP2_9GAMM|nr:MULTISPECIES: MGMT family protein [Dasania]MCR8923645.1 MGMT family protein [Dasania sp. GY-MA-18]MCZ0866079.1 MGMT family protein [Dasania phycosphaerae]MCZ0869803.1 MGMT family protein [Dasania phycosphaerae]
MTEISNAQKIWLAVQQIPAGKVATYGQVAELAGIPGAARLVGNTMHKLPAGSQLPWHRVVSAQGKLSLPENSSGYREQKLRLESEGIVFKGQRIPLAHYRWQP